MGRYIDTKIKCICGKEFDNPLWSHPKITRQQREDYIYDRGCIQNIMPDVDKTTRECLISGMCVECQKKLFGS